MAIRYILNHNGRITANTDDLRRAVKEMDALMDRTNKRKTGGEVDDRERILSDFFADKRNAVGDYWCKQMAWEAHQSIVAEQSRALAESRAECDRLREEVRRQEELRVYWFNGCGAAQARAERLAAFVERLECECDSFHRHRCERCVTLNLEPNP